MTVVDNDGTAKARDNVLMPGIDLGLSAFQSLDGQVRAQLADSLHYIFDRCAAAMNCPHLDIASALREIRAHRTQPGIFGRYYEMVFAIRGGHYAQAEALLHELVSGASIVPASPPTILPFSERALGADMERYGRLLDFGSDQPISITPPAKERWTVFQRSVRSALDIIERVDGELAKELQGLIVQIIGATSAEAGFGGASSFMLWGAIFLNADKFQNDVDLLGGLVHEAAHQLLFALSCDEPFITNPLDERFVSPLRSDLRPMDGVFHATFVCARMHYIYWRLKRTGRDLISRSEFGGLDERLRRHRLSFDDGNETIRRHGRLTSLGERVLGSASTYMQSAD